MPNNCCPSKSNSCVENCVKQCREQYCRSKYEKLAKKLIKTGCVQDACSYQADRFLDTVAGAKWNWLNTYLINNATAANTTGPSSEALAPAGYGSTSAFLSVDPTLSNYVFAIQYEANDLLNATALTGNGVPLVQDIFQNVFSIDSLTSPPGSGGTLSFGTSTINEIAIFSDDGYPELNTYTNAYITGIKQLIAQLPVTEAIAGPVGVPLIVDAEYIIANASGVSINKISRVGIIKWEYTVESVVNYYYIIYAYGRPICNTLC